MTDSAADSRQLPVYLWWQQAVCAAIIGAIGLYLFATILTPPPAPGYCVGDLVPACMTSIIPALWLISGAVGVLGSVAAIVLAIIAVRASLIRTPRRRSR